MVPNRSRKPGQVDAWGFDSSTFRSGVAATERAAPLAALAQSVEALVSETRRSGFESRGWHWGSERGVRRPVANRLRP